MLKLGRAQGVAMAVALSRDIPITEYAPLKIKMAITGNGQASKEQVADMLHAYFYGCNRRIGGSLLSFPANGAADHGKRL